MLNKPVTMKVGSWVLMTFDAYLEYRGIVWLRAKGGFGNGQAQNWHPREDWIAMLPSVSIHVGRYFSTPNEWRPADAVTIWDAMDIAVDDAIDHGQFDLRRKARELELLSIALNMLTRSRGMRA